MAVKVDGGNSVDDSVSPDVPRVVVVDLEPSLAAGGYGKGVDFELGLDELFENSRKGWNDAAHTNVRDS